MALSHFLLPQDWQMCRFVFDIKHEFLAGEDREKLLFFLMTEVILIRAPLLLQLKATWWK